MVPFALHTDRLVLDQPVESDVELVAEYCTDPLFERFLTIPWPYQRGDAEGFVRAHVPGGWERDDEWTWALRTEPGAELLGVVSWRAALSDLGFWLGGTHRGHGFMTEAVSAVIDAVFARRDVDSIAWECVAGNRASAAIARRLGFRYDGERPADVVRRDGVYPPAWHAVLERGATRESTEGWPV